MNRILQKFSLVALGMIFLIAGCDKDGENEWLYSKGKDFQPISNLRGEAGYGYALLRWDLPEESGQLLMVDISWLDAANQLESKKLTGYDDSLWLELEVKDYNFQVTSLGASGEIVRDSIMLHVQDWRAEPVENIQSVTQAVVGNSLELAWAANTQRAFGQTNFELYDASGTTLINKIVRKKDEAQSAQFTGLEYKTAYILRYYSENQAGIYTDTVAYSFTTGRGAVQYPTIELDENHVYAYSANIKWAAPDPSENMDSLRISFEGLTGNCAFAFGANDGSAFLSLLPGGSVTIKVSAKVDGETTWTTPAEQKLITKKPGDKYTFRVANGPTAGESKLAQAFQKSWGVGTADKQALTFTYQDLYEKIRDNGNVFEIWFKPYELDEIELCPTITTLKVNGNYTYTPDMNQFRYVIEHLPNLKAVELGKGYVGYAKLKEVLAEYPWLTVKEV